MTATPGAVRGVYIRQAVRWDAARPQRLIELRWLERLTAGLAGAAVLDLGCGSGRPIGVWLDAQGFALTGVDFAGPMLDLARVAVPGARWVEGDMRTLDLGERFAAIVAWDSFFHLPRKDQGPCLQRILAHLAPGGRFLLTTGPRDGEVTGTIGGEPVYHASLAPTAYQALVAAAGCRVLDFVPEDPNTASHTVWLIGRDG